MKNDVTVYRIKPEPKPDVVLFGKVFAFDEQYSGNTATRNLVEFRGFRMMSDIFDNLKLTFDGETGNLKSAEIYSVDKHTGPV